MAKINQPDMILMRDGKEISRHRELVKVMEVVDESPELPMGEYTLVRPDVTITKVSRQVIDDPVEPDTPDEPDTVEPEPVPEPMLDPATRPAAIRKRVNKARLLNFTYWNWATSRYSRNTSLTIWRKDEEKVTFKLQDMTTKGGGGTRELTGKEYTLYVDGIANATITITERQKTYDIYAQVKHLAPGPHIITLSEYGDETCVPYPIYVLRPGEALPDQHWVAVFTGSHEIEDWFHLVWVPAQHAPLPWPLPQRDVPVFDTFADPDDMYVEQFIGAVTGHPRIMNRNKDGIYSTATKQRYFWSDVIAKHSVIEMLDGPRGTNSHAAITHISPGTARLHDDGVSQLMGNTYFTTTRGFHRADKYGKVTTLAGAYHDNPAPYYGDETPPRQRGDWSEVEDDRRGFWLIWGMAWLRPSVEVDHSAAPIMDQGALRNPHKTGPIALLADSRHDAVRGCEFSATEHDVEPRIFEFYRGEEGADCWDNVAWRDKILIAERGKHRVIQTDSKGNIERVVIEGEDLAFIDRYHVARPRDGVTLDQLLDSPTVSPEGLFVRGDWLYFTSSVQAQVRRKHLIDGRLETVVPHFGRRNLFGKIAVDPNENVYIASWDIQPPEAYRPDGTRFHLPSGAGSESYNMAVGFDDKQIIYSAVTQGMKRITMRTPSDPMIDQRLFNQGEKAWKDLGLYPEFGDGAESPYGLERPWGRSPETDYYMKVLGHNSN